MQSALRSGRRLFALAVACWVMTAPLTALALDTSLCRHRAMRQGMSPGDASGASCWCSDMAGPVTIIAAETPSLPADLILMPAGSSSGRAMTQPPTASLPASPTYAPTPPPPNARNG